MTINTKRGRVAFMHKQSRKHNRLENYDYSQDGAYFVTICTQDRKPVLSTTGNVVGWYKYQVTKQANRLRNTPGAKLFQRSYYDHVIRNQQDYDEICQYIENNPRKWVMKP